MSQPPRLVFLSKRRPSGGDLYQRPFGRFGNLPIELAKKGCKVTVICLSHRRDENDQRQYMGVDWVSISASPNPLSAISRLKKQTCEFEPDWVVGFSDTYYGILATHLAKKIGCQSLVGCLRQLPILYSLGVSTALGLAFSFKESRPGLGRRTTTTRIIEYQQTEHRRRHRTNVCR